VIEHLKKMVKEGLPEDTEKEAEAEAQKLHDKYIKKVDEMLVEKENEIMRI
jgi:ribosome recycling factor